MNYQRGLNKNAMKRRLAILLVAALLTGILAGASGCAVVMSTVKMIQNEVCTEEIEP